MALWCLCLLVFGFAACLLVICVVGFISFAGLCYFDDFGFWVFRVLVCFCYFGV